MSPRQISHSKQVLRSGAKLYSSQMVVNVLLMGFGIYLAHTLSKEDMAFLAIYFLLLGLAGVLTNLGVTETINKRIPELLAKNKHQEVSSQVRTALLIRIGAGICFSLILFFLSRNISLLFLKTESYSNLIKMVSILVFFDSLFVSCDVAIRSFQWFGRIAKIRVIRNASSRLFAIIFFLLMGIKGLLIGFLIGSLIGLFICIYHLREYLFRQSPLLNFKDLMKYSSPYYYSGLSIYLFGHIDQYLIGLLLMPEHLAAYFIAKKIAGYMQGLIGSLVDPVLPKLIEFKANSIEKVNSAFTKTSRYMSFVFIPLCFGMASISYPLLYLYGGSRYLNATPLLSILSFAMIPYAYVSLFAMSIFAIGKPIEWFKMHLVGGVLSTVLGLILIYFFENVGIATSQLLALLGTVGVGFFILKRLMNFKFDIEALKHAIFSSIFMAFLIVMPQLFYYKLYLIPFYLLIGIAGFMTVFIRRFSNEDMKLIEDFLPTKLKPLTKIFSLFQKSKVELLTRIGG